MYVVTPILLDVLLLQLLVPLKFVLNGTVKGGLWAPIDVWTTSCKDDSKTNHRLHLLLGLVKKPLLNLKRETSPRLCRRIFLIAHELS